VKLFRRSASVIVVAAGVTAIASACSSSSTGLGGSDIVIEPDGATFLITDGGMIPIIVNESGTISVAPGSDAMLPTLPGSDATTTTTTPGFDATATTTMPGSDATVTTTMPGSDATTTTMTGSDATTTMPLPDGSCPDTGAPAACSATVASGAIVLSSSYLTAAAGGIGMGGYAYAYNDSQNDAGGTSASCLAASAMCTSGMTDISNSTGTHYGAGIGFNLNQAQSTGCSSMPINPYTVPSGSVGLSYTISNLPPGGARIAIGNFTSGTAGAGNQDYCATLTAASGTIPWAQFNSQCWVNTAGDFLTGPPTAPIHVEFQLPSGAAAASFNFCVESVKFATTLGDSGTTTTTTNCNGSSCCEPTSGPDANGNGVFSCYTFKQGTPNDKTFCGYNGSESAYTGGGSGACQAGALAYNDTVTNVAGNSGFFAAFPSSNSAWGQGAYCGMCVNVTYAGKTDMATIVDECATCSDSTEHIDLSANLARDLGIGVGTVAGDPTGVTWKAVACPITSNGGNIEVVWNSSGQAYFQNVVWPVKSVSGASQMDGFWNVSAGATVTLTDLIGHQITATMPGASGGSLGKQFPSTCTN
jgi:hypothetical protein